MTDDREIKNVTKYERENLHKLLDQLLDEGKGLGTFSVAYTHPSHKMLIRQYRIRINQQDTER